MSQITADSLSHLDGCCQGATNKRGLARQLKLLEVAQKHFLAQGYAGTSVNEIVKEAGGSLNTLYRHFGNKLGLFEAVFKSKANELFKPFENTEFWSDDLRTNLTHFGRVLQAVSLSADGIAMYRLVATENNHEQSEIQKIFYQHGPQAAIAVLAAYLQKVQDSGKIQVGDPSLAAGQFLEMIKGPFFYRALFGETIGAEEMERTLSHGVELFLHGCMRSAGESKSG
ncbi:MULTISPECIES: TetR/AcrR family transcriptional regulator [Thiomicrorhabdus]|uniref:TetR/AcrR family transcriptional regulator n=1 Tax=Thiomicrorhabdus heinhorstiae TaxID=2748010 RepID=A0ABS0BV87_9GAMM|nr:MULTISPECIES: TetR/AcrR family transcriptional regulator [Thiomicrorhabdus]MBF6057738.1 TetR/AcrR family transcriptional regulator [Thiomicrorhabdus heinhorstiae]